MQYLLLDHGDYLCYLRALVSVPYSSELSLYTCNCGFFFPIRTRQSQVGTEEVFFAQDVGLSTQRQNEPLFRDSNFEFDAAIGIGHTVQYNTSIWILAELRLIGLNLMPPALLPVMPLVTIQSVPQRIAAKVIL
jgi:hypothetical protein